MRSYAFLRSRRWAGIIALAVAACVVCALLGRWQFHRYEGKADMLRLVEINFEAAPVPLTEVFASPDSPLEAELTWHPAEATGTFVGEPVILPQRGIPGTAGDHLLGVLEIAPTGQEGATAPPRYVIVDRGWHPFDTTVSSEPPDGEVTVTGRLRAAETASERGIRAHQVFVINPEQVAGAAGAGEAERLLSSTYLMALPGPAQDGLQGFPKPQEDLGPHLSYAFQWWVFSLGALVGLVVLARREAAMDAGPADPEVRAEPARRKQRRMRDADEEDALIDAQLGNVD